MSLRLIPVGCLALIVCFSAALGANEQVEATADELSIDHKARKATFRGQVKLEYKQMTISCDHLEASYDEKGQLLSLLAKGSVVVQNPEAKATAQRAWLDTRSATLVLEGNPKVVRGELELKGQRIRISLDTLEVKVDRARGRFKLKVAP